MLRFRRRSGGGRHSLGAAVTGIPSAPRWADLPVAAPPLLPAASSDVPSRGRVELGFRDGTSRVLEPDSEQARALHELAGLLSERGHPYGSSRSRFGPTSTE
jgi:hypothetical protein